MFIKKVLPYSQYSEGILPVVGVEAVRRGQSHWFSEALFLSELLICFMQLHECVIESWERFGETQKELQRRLDADMRRRELYGTPASRSRKKEKEFRHLYTQKVTTPYVGDYLPEESRHLSMPA